MGDPVAEPAADVVAHPVTLPGEQPFRPRPFEEAGHAPGELEPVTPAAQLDCPALRPPVGPADPPVHLVKRGGRYGLRLALAVGEQDRAAVELGEPFPERQLGDEPGLVTRDSVKVVAQERLLVDRTQPVEAFRDGLGYRSGHVELGHDSLLVCGGVLGCHGSADDPGKAPRVRRLQCRERTDGRGVTAQGAGLCFPHDCEISRGSRTGAVLINPVGADEDGNGAERTPACECPRHG